jgi:hypothetical protein
MESQLVFWNGQTQLTSLLSECWKKIVTNLTSYGTFL